MTRDQRVHTRVVKTMNILTIDSLKPVARSGLKSVANLEQGRVDVTYSSNSVTVALVGGRWFKKHTERDGLRDLLPLAPVGHEYSAARAVAVELLEARSVE